MTAVLATAVAVGLVAGLASGGRLSRLRRVKLRSVWLLVAGAGLHAIVVAGGAAFHRAPATAASLVSYGALAAFAARNLARPGMGIVLLGVVLNAVPIAVDHGMPVEGNAIVAAGVATAGRVGLVSFGGRHHLATPADHLRALDDAVPEWVTHQVLSPGDLVVTVGVGAVVAGLVRPARRRPRRRHAAQRGRHDAGVRAKVSHRS